MVVRSFPGSFDLSFLLPREGARPRPDFICRNACSFELDGPLVRIRGDSRETVFDCASDLLRTIHDGAPLSVSAILHSPSRPSGFDRWSIIVGADVAFSPTSLDPHFPRAADA